MPGFMPVSHASLKFTVKKGSESRNIWREDAVRALVRP
jgi:hypothetical protein